MWKKEENELKVIETGYPHTFNINDFPPLSVALGFFDGVHKGHQQVISTAVDIASRNGWKSAVMTFYPHPLKVLKKGTEVHYITPIEDKISYIEELGVDYLFIVRFTPEFASLMPQQFVEEYLVGLNVKHVTAGFDYSYGCQGKGNMETLPVHAGGKLGCTVIERIDLEEEKISSTKIRAILKEGDMEGFRKLAGRLYVTKGTVVHGEKRGRKLGFPTANTLLDDEYIIPSTGVYAVRLQMDGIHYPGVCNVGYKPTFHDQHPGKPSVEVHLFDFEGDIYGKRVAIEWNCRLRSEKKFSGLEELVAQINKDKQSAKEFFNMHSI